MRRLGITLLVFLAAALFGTPGSAGILEDIQSVFTPSARTGGGIDAVAAQVKSLPVQPDRPVLAAHATQEGHWRLVNRAGETVTAASPDELARALNLLTPEMTTDSKVRLTVYLTEDTVFSQRALLKDLPRADLHVVVGSETYALLAERNGATPRLFAEVRPRLIVEVTGRAGFDEAVEQLARPLAKAQIRTIALEPGGPPSLPSAPRIDPATKRALTDVVEPDRLRHTLGSLGGQTALITGRVEGDLLYFKPASGPERSLLLRDLTTAAEASDVNLIVLKSSSPRQPGARNWLWQRVEVANLESAIERGKLSDFLTVLARDTGRMTVTATAVGASRTHLDIQPARGLAGEPASTAITNPISSVFNDILSEVTAKVPVRGISAYMRSTARDQELSRRIVPGVPAWLQISYAAALGLGLLGFAVARGWWCRIWPPERSTEYGNAFGFQAARAARNVIFALLFLPLAGPLACLSLPFRRRRSGPDVAA